MIITEHSDLPVMGRFNPYEWSDHYKDGLLLNDKASSYDQKYFFIWNREYRAGLTEGHEKSVAVNTFNRRIKAVNIQRVIKHSLKETI